jgi:acetyl-CoA acetyltransferase
MAFHGAYKDILSGEAEMSLAIGVEKTYFQDDPARTLEIFEGGIDQLDPDEWMNYYKDAGEHSGKPFSPGTSGGTLFMDTYAMQAAYHMKTFGTTREQIALAASKNHAMGALNPKAQYRFEVTPEQVLADREVSWPLTRSMCSPVGDGASAALLCSARMLSGLPPMARERAIRVRASVLSGGKYRRLDEPGLSRVAAQRAYQRAGLQPKDIDVAEVHDATSFCEIYQAEMLGFCELGQGGSFVSSGATSLNGKLPINLSGGLVSKGHPVGATGLSMIYELTAQLRGECGPRQAKGADVALAENGGGVIGFDEAACSITLLQR